MKKKLIISFSVIALIELVSINCSIIDSKSCAYKPSSSREINEEDNSKESEVAGMERKPALGNELSADVVYEGNFVVSDNLHISSEEKVDESLPPSFFSRVSSLCESLASILTSSRSQSNAPQSNAPQSNSQIPHVQSESRNVSKRSYRSPISSGSGHSMCAYDSGLANRSELGFIPTSFSPSIEEEINYSDGKGVEYVTEFNDKVLEKFKKNSPDQILESSESEENGDDNVSYNSQFSYDDLINVKKGNRNSLSDFEKNDKILDEASDLSDDEAKVDETDYSSEFEYEVTPLNSNSDPFGGVASYEQKLPAHIEGAVDENVLNSLKIGFLDNSKMLKMNTLASIYLFDVLLKRDKNVQGMNHVSNPLSIFFEPANQKLALNCAVYPVLGAIRYHLNRKINLMPNFQFNSWHLNLFDLLEKSNAFLEILFRHIHLPLNSPELISLLGAGIDQASNWHSILRLIEKYGIAPSFPNVEYSNNNHPAIIIRTLNSTLRAAAKRFHDCYHGGKDDIESSLVQLKQNKIQVLESIYNILGISFGVPFEGFEWNLTTRDGKAIRKKFPDGPKEFYEKIVGREFGDQVALCNYPQLGMNRHYGIRVDYRMIDHTYRKFINLPIEKLTQYALEIILSDRPLPISAVLDALECEKNGTLDESRFDYESVFELKNYFMSKENIFATRNYTNLHAFLIVGVNLDSDNRPTHWLVESSWGQDFDKKGNKLNHLFMTHDWFCKYVFEIIVPRDMLHEQEGNLANGPSLNYDQESTMY